MGIRRIDRRIVPGGPWMPALVAALFVVIALSDIVRAAPSRPFPQHVALAAGTLLPNHHPRTQIDDDVRALYDAWKTRYLAQAGTEIDGHPRYRVLFSRSPGDKTVSEGMGYGMLVVPLMAGHDPDAQTIFDGLWEFVRDHHSTIDPRLMDWTVDANEVPEPDGNDSAFDGDCDIALGLLIAETQWGDGGRFDYGADAQAVIAGILASTIGPVSRLPMLGDWVDPNGQPYSQWTTRTSDFMLSNFRAFAVATGDPVWNQVIAATQAAVTHVQSVYSPGTGLLPDFLVPASGSDHTLEPARPHFLEGTHDGEYYYNAVRDPFRLGLDAAVAGDATSRDQVRTISAWALGATGGDPNGVQAGRRLDGSLQSGASYFTTIFAATLGVAAMNTPGQQQWLNDLYDAVRASDEGYFEDSVTLLSLLAMTGNFWVPAAPPPVCGNGVVEAGETCDDHNTTDGDGCDSNCTPTTCGNGIVTAGETCDDGNHVAGDCCGASCQLESNGSPCDDDDPCSHTDVCSAGVCRGTLAPASGCANAPRGVLQLRDDKPGSRRLSWRWSAGTIAAPDLGDPASGGTSYALCVFDASGGTPALRLRASIAGGGTCSGKPCWSAAPTGFRYRNGATFRQVKLASGAGRASLQVQAKGTALPTLGLPLAEDPWVTVQLGATTGACWESRFTASTRNDGARFTATAP